MVRNFCTLCVRRGLFGGWWNDREIEGLVIPWHLGRARIDYNRCRTLFLPIPLNLVVTGFDRLYLKARRGAVPDKRKLSVWTKAWRYLVRPWHECFHDEINESYGFWDEEERKCWCQTDGHS